MALAKQVACYSCCQPWRLHWSTADLGPWGAFSNDLRHDSPGLPRCRRRSLRHFFAPVTTAGPVGFLQLKQGQLGTHTHVSKNERLCIPRCEQRQPPPVFARPETSAGQPADGTQGKRTPIAMDHLGRSVGDSGPRPTGCLSYQDPAVYPLGMWSGPIFQADPRFGPKEHSTPCLQRSDVIAERIPRRWAILAPVSFGMTKSFAHHEVRVSIHASAHDMVLDLIAEHEAGPCAPCAAAAAKARAESDDMVTEDMLTARLTFQ